MDAFVFLSAKCLSPPNIPVCRCLQISCFWINKSLSLIKLIDSSFKSHKLQTTLAQFWQTQQTSGLYCPSQQAGVLDTLGLYYRYCFCLNWPQVSGDQQQINTIENKCSWSTDFLLCRVTSIYLVESAAWPSQVTVFFVCRAFKVNSQLTLSFLRGPDCWL